MNWTSTQRARALVALGVLLLVAVPLYMARRALLPFVLGAALVYILLPLTNFLNSALPASWRRRGLWRSLSVLAVYVLVIAAIVGLLGFVIPPIGAQVGFLAQRLPEFARNVYTGAPEIVRVWMDEYNQIVPESIRAAIQRSVEGTIQSLISTIQTGIFKSIGVVFSTLSFVLGLLVVPFWMFYVLRDQPQIGAWFSQLVPEAYREDMASVVTLMDAALGAYLRGRIILGFCMAVMCTVGLLVIRIDFALLLGTIAGVFEIVPVIGIIIGAIPIMLVTLATSPSQLLWVILLIVAAQQIVDYLLLPLVARGTVGLHPALVMLVIVVGSEVAGVWGVLLGVPVAAAIRDVAHYVSLRLSEQPLPPRQAVTRVNARL